MAYVGTAGAAELQKVPHRVDGRSGNLPHLVCQAEGMGQGSGPRCRAALLQLRHGRPLSTLPAKTWVFGGGMGIPALMGALRHDTYVIANCNDEAMVNAVMVAPTARSCRPRAITKSYPNVYTPKA